MIDFVSTRDTTDPQSARCARLLAAVIALAVRDAATEAPEGSADAYAAETAGRFLFGDNQVFAGYAALIGSSARVLREQLVRNATPAEEEAAGKRGRNDFPLNQARRILLQDFALRFTPRTPGNAAFLAELAQRVNSRPRQVKPSATTAANDAKLAHRRAA